MDAFLGSWKAGPGDFQNVEEYAKALNQPDLGKHYAGGAELVATKDGDNYIFTNSVSGVQTVKETLGAGGSVSFESSHFPADAVKLSYKLEGDKILIDGTIMGMESTSSRSIQDGKLVTEMTLMGVTLTATYTKV